MSETSPEDEHAHDGQPRLKTPDEHSGNQDLQALLHRRQEAEEKLQERQERQEQQGAADQQEESGR